jgi:hypothetical protein
MTRKTIFKTATPALLVTALLLLALTTFSSGADPCPQGTTPSQALGCVKDAVRTAVQQVTAPVAPAPQQSAPAAQPSASQPAASQRAAAPRQSSEPSATQPPLHGTDPHGQGTVAVVDTNPSSTRPLSGDPTGGSDEDIVVGRARGEQGSDGSYHRHVVIAALFGNEILGVDTAPGETKHGPLDAVQTSLLDALCSGSGDQLCVKLATADSATTDSGSTNHFGVAHVTLGGANGLDAGVAESNGNISSDGTCQTTHGDSQVADVNAGGQALADVAKSSSDSKACKGQAPQQTNTSSVIGLGGTGVPLPAAGCADGTPDTVTGIPTLVPIVCNADDSNGSQADAPYGVREALDVFLLATNNSSLAKVMAAGSESHSVAPPEQCADKIDNDGDGLIDAADPQCHTDGNAGNPGSYNPGGTSEAGSGAQCADGKDNDGDGLVDGADPGCHTDGDATNPDSYSASDNSEGEGGTGSGGSGNGVQCADGKDNDGDGLIDANDPGCHSDGDASNPASYDAGDDSEAGGAGGVAGVSASRSAASGSLPFTGTDVVLVVLSALLLLGAGLAVRRVSAGRDELGS